VQVFVVELKKWSTIKSILEIIDKAIPYHIIFVVRYDGESYVSTSAKHLQKFDENKAVIDHTFISAWFQDDALPYHINLQESIDKSYRDLCAQLCDRYIAASLTYAELVNEEIEIRKIKNEIKFLRSKVKKSKQFNKKVELNMQLKKVEKGLEKYYNIDK
jgi:thymidylate kinase